jgi:hypothetical protein
MKQSMLILLISIMAALCSMAFAQSGYISTFSKTVEQQPTELS